MEKKFVAQYLALFADMVASEKVFGAAWGRLLAREIQRKYTSELMEREKYVRPLVWAAPEEFDADGKPIFRTKGDTYGAGGAAEEASLKHGVITDTEPSVAKAESTLEYWQGRLSKVMDMIDNAELGLEEALNDDHSEDEEIIRQNSIKAKSLARIAELRIEWKACLSRDGQIVVERLAAEEQAIIRNTDNNIARRMKKLEKKVAKKAGWVATLQDSMDYILERIEAAEANLMNEDDIAAGIDHGEKFSIVLDDQGTMLPNWEHWNEVIENTQNLLANIKGRISRGLLGHTEAVAEIEKLIGQHKHEGWEVKEFRVKDEVLVCTYCDWKGGQVTMNVNPKAKIFGKRGKDGRFGKATTGIVMSGTVDGKPVEKILYSLKPYKYTAAGQHDNYTFALCMIELFGQVDFDQLSERQAKLFENRYNRYCSNLEAKLVEREERAAKREEEEGDDAFDKSFRSEASCMSLGMEAAIDWKRNVRKLADAMIKFQGISEAEAIEAAILQEESKFEKAVEVYTEVRDYSEELQGFGAHADACKNG